jgi:hypothetical protein
MAEAPEHVLAAFARALRDLQGDDPIALEVIGYEPERLFVRERGEADSTGLWVPEGEDMEDLVVALADQLQEQVFPETRGAWGQARPACPGHAHPAAAELVDGRAVWVCPEDGRELGPIGRLS